MLRSRIVVFSSALTAAWSLLAHEWLIQDYIADQASLTRDQVIDQCVSAEGDEEGESSKAFAFDGIWLSPTVRAFWSSKIDAANPAALVVKLPTGVTAPKLLRYRIVGLFCEPSVYSYTWQLFPRDFVLQGRDSDDDGWTDVDAQNGITISYSTLNTDEATVSKLAYDFSLCAPTQYRQYRLRFDEAQQNQAGHCVAVMEVSLVVDDDVTAPAATYCVTPSGTDAGDGSWANPMTLKAALAKAQPHDEIHVQEGTYDYANIEQLVATNACTIRGGYAGTEGSTEAPAGTLRSTFDLGGVKTNGLEIAVNDPLIFKLENLVFTNAFYRGLSISGTGGTLKNCAFLRNGWAPTVATEQLIAGRGINVNTPMGSELQLEGCEFRNNVNRIQCNGGFQSNAGSGIYAFQTDLVLTNCLFAGNGQRADKNSQTYGRDCSPGAAICAHKGRVKAYGCGFYGNRNTLNTGGGGGTNANSDGSIVHLFVGRDGSSFENCRFIGNSYAPWNGSADSGVLVVSLANKTNEVSVNKCTFAYNLHGACAGIAVFTGKARIRNSIFYGNLVNATAAKGADVTCMSATASAEVDYSLFRENSSAYLNTGNGTLTVGEHNVYGDPLFATDYDTVKTYIKGTLGTYPTATHPFYYDPLNEYQSQLDFETIDVHVKSGAGRWTPSGYVTTDGSLLSPAIDAGDDSDYSNEPAPNGGAVNLGCYGNTDQASKSSAAMPEIASAAVTMTDDYTRPKIAGALASGELPYVANVEVCYGYEQGADDGSSGWTWRESLATGVGPGSVFEKDCCRYLESGRTLYWRVVVTKNGNVVASTGGSLVVTGTLPPLWGRGVGADYIHVWAGGQGSNGGTDWLDACTTIEKAAALVTSTRTNIIIAGSVASLSAEPLFAAPVSVWGGFDTAMTSFAERDPATYPSVIHGGDAYGCFKAGNTSGCTALRDVTFTRSQMSAMIKTGAGNLWLERCRFVNCGVCSNVKNEGRGLNVQEASAATIVITNCAFEGNVSYQASDTYGCSGCAIKSKAAKRFYIDDTLFATNGFNWRAAKSTVPGRDNTYGWVLDMEASPVTVRNCKFLGNRTTGNGEAQGSIIRLSGMNTSQPCAFTNCLFAGNALYPNSDGTAGCALFRIEQSANAAPVDFYACTMAYNLYLEAYAPIFYLTKGAVRVRNSILAENVHGSLSGKANIACFAAASATLDLDWCLIGPTTANALPDVAALGKASVSQATIGANVIRDGYVLFGTKEADFLANVYGANSAYTNFFHEVDKTERAAFRQDFDPTALNLHLSRGRYVDETTGASRSIHGGSYSPALDAGDPTSDYSREPRPNGNRIDLGCFGNTPWTTIRSPGVLLIFH